MNLFQLTIALLVWRIFDYHKRGRCTNSATLLLLHNEWGTCLKRVFVGVVRRREIILLAERNANMLRVTLPHIQCWCVNSAEVGECYYYYLLERTLDFIKLPQQLPGMMIWLPTSKVSGDIYSVKSVMALS